MLEKGQEDEKVSIPIENRRETLRLKSGHLKFSGDSVFYSIQGEGVATPRKRGPKPQPLIMKATYVAPEGWDYKRAIYPTMREWGFFDDPSN